jgi:hypothetical protein
VWYLKQQFRQGDNIDQKDGIFWREHMVVA